MKILLAVLLNLLYFVAHSQNKINYVSMQRTACFGFCPEYKIELFQNGDIVYIGKKNVDRIGKYSCKITQIAMRNFLKGIAKYKLLSLASNYKTKATDIPRLNMQFLINGKSKSIKNAESGPKYLEAIGKRIDSFVNTLKLVEMKVVDNNHTHETPEKNADIDESKLKLPIETQAEFPGGFDAMLQFISANLKYPSSAVDQNIQGKVICNFIINKSGEIENVKILKGIGFGCDEEAIRVVKMMPRWKPATQNGKTVNMNFNLPISFKLQ